jgi:hypothetical protein
VNSERAGASVDRVQRRSIPATAQAISLRQSANSKPGKRQASPKRLHFGREGWSTPRNPRSAGGRLHAGEFALFDECAPSPATPNWSPVRTFGGYAAWADPDRTEHLAFGDKLALSCGRGNSCSMHSHNHAIAWSQKLPFDNLRSFRGAIGCTCWAAKDVTMRKVRTEDSIDRVAGNGLLHRTALLGRGLAFAGPWGRMPVAACPPVPRPNHWLM